MCESLGDECQGIIGKDIKQSVLLPAKAPWGDQKSNSPSTTVGNRSSSPGEALNGYQDECHHTLQNFFPFKSLTQGNKFIQTLTHASVSIPLNQHFSVGKLEVRRLLTSLNRSKPVCIRKVKGEVEYYISV